MSFLVLIPFLLSLTIGPTGCADKWEGDPPADPRQLLSQVERVQEFSRLSVMHMNHHTVAMYANGQEFTTHSFHSTILHISPDAYETLAKAQQWETLAWLMFGSGLLFHAVAVWRRRQGSLSLIIMTLACTLGLAGIMRAEFLSEQAHRLYFRDLHRRYLSSLSQPRDHPDSWRTILYHPPSLITR